MILITWNTQWCRGVDGRVDPARIVAEAKRLADFDVLCVQEIADNFPDPLLPGAIDEDQFATLARLLPGYTAHGGFGVDHPGEHGRRRRFGNMILSRLPVTQVFRHLLPFPLDRGVKGMPRVGVEAIVEAPSGSLRVITTHLEYYSKKLRSLQVEALRTIYAEGYAHARHGPVTDTSGNPYHSYPRPQAALICGDFNFEPEDPLHARMVEGFPDDTPPLVDAWERAHPGVPHAATFKIYEKVVPGEPVLHCDFVFLNAPLAARLRSVVVDQHTQASDHQPVIVEMS